MKLLHIDSSILASNSVSRELTASIVREWTAAHPDTEVQYLDLAQSAPTHLSAESLGFRLPAGSELTDAQRRENAVSEALVSQFLAADVIVVGAPLYNFSVPSQLKAWIDRVAQVGRTFAYSENGPIGLAGNKTVFVAVSRGGVYSTTEAGQALEHQESYLKTVFGFFGIKDVRVVRAEGVAMGATARASAMQQASAEIAKLFNDASNEARVAVAA